MSENPRSILIGGVSGTGKSTSLRGLKDQKGVLYLNCEGGKPLPFKNSFKRINIDDPMEILDFYDSISEDTTGRYHTIVVDTVSFMMDKFESHHVTNSANTMKAWGDYGNFFRDLMLNYVAKSPAFTVFLGHLDQMTVEETGETRISVPVKGALKKNGLEAFFTTVISTVKMPTKKLKWENNLLNITPEEEEDGFKHVFQTRTTKDTTGDRIRSPMELFSRDELYIDNNAQNVITRLNEYYEDV